MKNTMKQNAENRQLNPLHFINLSNEFTIYTIRLLGNDKSTIIHTLNSL